MRRLKSVLKFMQPSFYAISIDNSGNKFRQIISDAFALAGRFFGCCSRV